MRARVLAKRIIPPRLLNTTLLTLPALYRTSLVQYESNIDERGHRQIADALSRTTDIPGDVVECGSSRCGTGIRIALALGSGSGKRVYCCDSFEGFDAEELERERANSTSTASANAFTSTSYEYVQAKIRRLGLQERVIPIRGYFEQTLPPMPGPFSVALIDCDLHDSMLFCARDLWPKLSSGAVMLFDDYHHERYKAARSAVDTFVDEARGEITEHGMGERLYMIRKR